MCCTGTWVYVCRYMYSFIFLKAYFINLQLPVYFVIWHCLVGLNSIPVSKWDGSLKTHYNNHQDSSHCLIQLCIVIFGMYLSKFSSRDETHSIVILLIHTYLFEKFIKEKYTDIFQGFMKTSFYILNLTVPLEILPY